MSSIAHGRINQTNSLIQDEQIIYRTLDKFSVTGITFTQVILPNFFQNVTTDYNNIMYSYNGGANQILVLPTGYYTLAQLLLQITASFAVVGINIVLTLLPNQFVQFVVTGGTISFARWISQTGTIQYQNQMYTYLGLTSQHVIFNEQLANFIGDEYPNVLVSSCVNIFLVDNNIRSPDFDGFCIGIPMDQSFGNTMNWQNIQSVFNRIDFGINSIFLDGLIIQLKDDNGRSMKLGNSTGNDLQYCFQYAVEY